MNRLLTSRLLVIAVFSLVFCAFFAQNIMTANAAPENPLEIKAGVWLINIEKVDLSANSYRLDFYLWFQYNPSEISLVDVQKFEFINGAPTMYVVDVNETQGYLEYRVRGDFIKTFDFSQYPFETHELAVEIEHKNLDVNSLVFEADPTSNIDPEANVAGWNLGGFQTSVMEHSYGDETFSRFVFSVDLQRPALSSFIKTVLPIAVITTISLLAFFMAPQNFAQRITLGVTTLLSATAFHLSLLSGIPPTGYLTFADKMMLSVYVIFLFNLSVSVYIMRFVEAKRIDDAVRVCRRSQRFLPILIIILIIIQAVALF
jgi:hypothetical protein